MSLRVRFGGWGRGRLGGWVMLGKRVGVRGLLGWKR